MSLQLFSHQTKERYEKSLEELDKLTPQYMENMEQVFEQWQQFEDKRIRFFKELLLEVKQHLDLSTNHRSVCKKAPYLAQLLSILLPLYSYAVLLC